MNDIIKIANEIANSTNSNISNFTNIPNIFPKTKQQIIIDEVVEMIYQKYLHSQEWGNELNLGNSSSIIHKKRYKRLQEKDISFKLPTFIGIYLPWGIAQRNNPPSNGEIIYAIKYASKPDIPFRLFNTAFHITHASRSGARVRVDGYYGDVHYYGAKYIKFLALKKKRDINTKLIDEFTKNINNEQYLPINNTNFVKSKYNNFIIKI